MTSRSRKIILFSLATLALLPVLAFADTQNQAVDRVRDSGVSALWILANFSYAGMKAQGHPDWGWRVLSFIFGLPGTLLTWIVVREGSERAYGVDIPKKRL